MAIKTISLPDELLKQANEAAISLSKATQKGIEMILKAGKEPEIDYVGEIKKLRRKAEEQEEIIKIQNKQKAYLNEDNSRLYQENKELMAQNAKLRERVCV